MKFRPLHLWIYLGLLGVVTFYLMRPVIDYNAAHPGNLDPRTVTQRTAELGEKLGFSLDSLVVTVFHNQNTAFYERLKSALGVKDNNSIHGLHQAGYPLSSWYVALTVVHDSASVNEAYSEAARRLGVRYDESGRILGLRVYQPRLWQVSVARDSVESGFLDLLSTFGYDASNYRLESRPSGPESAPGGPNEREFVLVRNEMVTHEPSSISLRFLPGRMSPTSGDRASANEIETLAHPFRPPPFEAPLLLETVLVSYSDLAVNPVATETFNDHGAYIYTIAIIIVGFIIVATVRRIFRNQVDWSRGSWVFFVVATLMVSWSLLHLFGYSVGNVPSNVFWLSMISTLVNSLLLSFFIAVSYLTWESMARIQNSSNLDVIDAMWRGRLFIRETGESILMGYAFGGVLLGVLTLLLYGADALLVKTITAGNFNELTSKAPGISAMPASLLGAFMIAFGPLGVIYNYFHKKVGGGIVCFVVTALTVAFSMTSLWRIVQTDQSLSAELGTYFLFSLVLVYLLQRFGMVSLVTALTLFVLAIELLPMMATNSSFYESGLLVAAVVGGIPFVFGVISLRYGQPVASEQRYVPKYQEVTIKQQRFEREIEIARESQFSLMPLSTPVLPAHDVKGFFIPSLEVGGDYYDYRIKYDANGDAQTLFMTVVDVSGKAMKAAMHAVFTSGLILSRSGTDSPEGLLASINPILKEKTDSRTFITCVIGEVDLHTNIMRLSNAGHCLPILKRDGKADFLSTPPPRFPLGMRAEVKYQGVDVPLKSGDVLLFYSDGLPEAKNEDNEEYTFERVKTYIEGLQTERMSSTEICLAIKKHIQQYSNYNMRDDTTLICLKVR